MVDFEAVIDVLLPGESEELNVSVEAPDTPGTFTNIAKATSVETGTVEAEYDVLVEEQDTEQIDEEQTPLDLPDTGVLPVELLYGLGAAVAGLGAVFTKKKRK